MNVYPFDFDDPQRWTNVNEDDTSLCDLCYEAKADAYVFTFASWEGGKMGGYGGGDIYIDYCTPCREKQRRKRLMKTSIFCADE